MPKEPKTGSGGSAGKATTEDEAKKEVPADQSEKPNPVEQGVPIGMPGSPDEIRGLKERAKKHDTD